MNRFGTAILLAMVFASAAVPVACAGDGAAINVLGFSVDGQYFAFEQYGEYDIADGFYSTITAIETGSGRPVKGMPIAVTHDPDDPALGTESREKQLADIRAKAAADAAAPLAQLGIATPGQMLMSVREARARSMLSHEQVKSAMKVVVGNITLPGDRFGAGTRLVLREFDIVVPHCKEPTSGAHPNGFGLTLERKGRPTIHLSRDQTIPPERGCPETYGIAEVHAHALPDGSTALAVVIQYFNPVSHGPERRFIVVTGRVP